MKALLLFNTDKPNEASDLHKALALVDGEKTPFKLNAVNPIYATFALNYEGQFRTHKTCPSMGVVTVTMVINKHSRLNLVLQLTGLRKTYERMRR